MTELEKLHYRNGYRVGLLLADFKKAGKRITGSATRPKPYPAPARPNDVSSHEWGISTALAGRQPHF